MLGGTASLSTRRKWSPFEVLKSLKKVNTKRKFWQIDNQTCGVDIPYTIAIKFREHLHN